MTRDLDDILQYDFGIGGNQAAKQTRRIQMNTKNLAIAPTVFTVLVRMCGRNRVRIAQSVRTDDQGRMWATVAGCGRKRERLVLAISAA